MVPKTSPTPKGGVWGRLVPNNIRVAPDRVAVDREEIRTKGIPSPYVVKMDVVVPSSVDIEDGELALVVSQSDIPQAKA